jgi:hypothetical protein
VLPGGATFGVGDGPTSVVPLRDGVLFVAASAAGKVQRYEGAALAAELAVPGLALIRVGHQ